MPSHLDHVIFDLLNIDLGFIVVPPDFISEPKYNGLVLSWSDIHHHLRGFLLRWKYLQSFGIDIDSLLESLIFGMVLVLEDQVASQLDCMLCDPINVNMSFTLWVEDVFGVNLLEVMEKVICNNIMDIFRKIIHNLKFHH